MRFLALAADYDGTLASHGSVDQPTLDALQRFTESGRKLVMVTGRQLDDLQTVFPHLELFSRVVAENGALLYDPRSKSQRMLAEPPNPAFVEELRGAVFLFPQGMRLSPAGIRMKNLCSM